MQSVTLFSDFSFSESCLQIVKSISTVFLPSGPENANYCMSVR